MDRKEIVAAAEAYWDDHRDAIVADIAKLVEIPSTEDLAGAGRCVGCGAGNRRGYGHDRHKLRGAYRVCGSCRQD